MDGRLVALDHHAAHLRKVGQRDQENGQGRPPHYAVNDHGRASKAIDQRLNQAAYSSASDARQNPPAPPEITQASTPSPVLNSPGQLVGSGHRVA